MPADASREAVALPFSARYGHLTTASPPRGQPTAAREYRWLQRLRGRPQHGCLYDKRVMIGLHAGQAKAIVLIDNHRRAMGAD